MSAVQVAAPSIRTLADLLDRLGGVPLDRIRFHPSPGMATVQDVIDVQRREGRLCELVEGVLLEKTVGYTESRLAVWLAGLLNRFVVPRNLGIVTGPDGTMELMPHLTRRQLRMRDSARVWPRDLRRTCFERTSSFIMGLERRTS